MVTVEKRNKKFYTEDGLNALQGKIKTYINIFNENNFPFVGNIFGFGKIQIDDQKECLAKILELSNITGFDAKLELNKGTGKALITY